MAYYDTIRITLKQCGKTYPNGTQALQPTDLVIEPGEILALLGPSGCGKTTLLRLIAGLEDMDAGGNILFGEQDVSRLPIERRNVGMVFQHYALFPQMTVEANIAYGLKIKKKPRTEIKQQVAELIRMMNLTGLEDRRPAQLSGGQRQRVALARAVAVRPRVLLLDEPLAALDAQLKETLRDELAYLLRHLAITAIHVTHDQQEAMAIADRLAIMYQGQIVQSGTAEDIYRNPTHPFAAEFLGRVNHIIRTEQELQANQLHMGGCSLACPAHLAGHRNLLLRFVDVNLCDEQTRGCGQAKVIKRSFLGERLQFTLQLSDGRPLIAETPVSNTLQADQNIGFTIQPECLMYALEDKK